jgi:hypothetical protein
MWGQGHLLTMSEAYAAGRVLAEAGAHVQRPGRVCRGRGVHAKAGTRMQRPGQCMQRLGCACRGWGARAEAGVTHADSRVDNTGEGR